MKIFFCSYLRQKWIDLAYVNVAYCVLNESKVTVLFCFVVDGEATEGWIFGRHRKIHSRGLSLSIWIWRRPYFSTYSL